MLGKDPGSRPPLDEVHEYLTDEQRFQDWAVLEAVLDKLHETGLFQQLPERFRNHRDNQRAFARAVVSTVPNTDFQEIAVRKDIKRLLSYGPIRREFNFMTAEERIADYLAVPKEGRVAYAEQMVKSVHADEGMSELDQIETSLSLMQKLVDVEHSEEARLRLKPLLDQASDDMDMLVQQMIQENPSDPM